MTATATPAPVAAAYAACIETTRREARNFFYGIRLLPPDRRATLCAVYAFARRADDFADDVAVGSPAAGNPPPPGLPATGCATPGERAARAERLAGLRAELAELAAPAPARPATNDPVLIALADATQRYPLPLDALAELLDGMQMDLDGARYATFEELLVYCRRVAGTIGRLCAAVFEVHGATEVAMARADALGVALQQTNILRDLREDRLAGRIYVPESDLRRYGVTLDVDADGRITDPPERLAALVRAGAARAEEWYREGLLLLPMLEWRSRASCAAMAGIYHALNHRIAADPARVASRRVALHPAAKAVVAARSLVGVAP